MTNCGGCGRSVHEATLIELPTLDKRKVKFGACCAVPALHIKAPVPEIEKLALHYGSVIYIMASPPNC